MIHRLSIQLVSGDEQCLRRFCDDLDASGYPLPVHAFGPSIVLTWADEASDRVYARFNDNLPALMNRWEASVPKCADAVLGRAYTGDEPAYVHGFLTWEIVRRINI
jgi:hypothetical protein